MKTHWKLFMLVGVAFVGLLGSVSAFGQELGGYSFVPLSGQPHAVIHDPDRGVAYVSYQNRSEIGVVRLSDLSVQTPIALDHPARGMTLTSDGSQLLATFYDQDQIGVVELTTGLQTRTIDVTPNPAQIDRDSTGRIFWRDAGSGNPYGNVFELDLPSGASTRKFGETILRYAHSDDRTKWLQMIDAPKAAVWDAPTDTNSNVVWADGFDYGHQAWITNGAINDTGSTILLTKSDVETRVFDGDFNYLGSIEDAMAWATFGPWENLAIGIEAEGWAYPSNRLCLMDTENLLVLDTLTIPEAIGASSFNTSAQPFELTSDASMLLAVGQTGLYIIDSSAIPEPATLSLLAMGGLTLLRRRK